jgi:hypothetical protein
MPVSAIVITLDLPLDSELSHKLSSQPGLELGSPQGNRLPAVLDTPTSRASSDTVEQLRSFAGVASVDIVSIDFSEGF